MKYFCNHCKLKFPIVTRKTSDFGVLYTLECEHQVLVSKQIHEEKERQSRTLLSRFRNWLHNSTEENNEDGEEKVRGAS